MDNSQNKETASSPRSGGSIAMPRMRRGPKAYFKDVQREMKNVSWPAPKETTRLTGVVLGVCILVTVLLLVLSLGVEFLMSALIGGPK